MHGLALLAVAAGLAGCSGMRWPWSGGAAAAPQAVRVLNVVVPQDAQIPIVLQYWDRNTLLVDLQGVASAGEISLTPMEGQPWPVRLEFRFVPGRFQVLEIRADQRMVYPITSEAPDKPAVVHVDPGVYGPGTARMAVRWGAR